MTCLIYYTGSSNFSTLLVQLQPQFSSSDDIYIVDVTPDRKGLSLVKLYGTSRSYIFVEVGRYSKSEAIDFGIQSAKENKQSGLLVIDQNCIISQTFISNIKKVKDYSVISPIVIKTPYPQMPSDFKWYNSSNQSIKEFPTFSLFCYYINFDNSSKMGVLLNETVIILPIGIKV